MKAFLIAAMTVAVASPAWADQPPAPPQDHGKTVDPKPDKGATTGVADSADAAKEAKDPNRRICRKQKVIGSRLGQKNVCATAAEWARLRAEEQQATELVQNAKSKSN